MREMKDSGIEWIGEIPKDWKITRVGNHFYFYSGDSLTSEDLNDDGIYPVYGANGIRGFYNKKNLTGSHIILGRVGALCGNVHLVDSELWVTEHALVSVPFTEYTINEFYRYMFETMNFRQYSKASAQPVLSAEVLRQLKMPIPKVSEQKRIADYLDEKCTKIDAIIEKQQEIIEKLKEYKLSVITEAVTKGLNPDVEMKDSGIECIGKIPIDWIVKKFKHMSIEIGDGLHGTPDYDSEGEYYFINGQNIGEEELVFTEKTDKINEEEYRKYKQVNISQNTIFITLNGATYGKTSFYNGEKVFLGKSAGYITFKDEENKRFIRYYLQSHAAKTIMDLSLCGSTIANLSLATLNEFCIPLPCEKKQIQIVNFLDKKCSAIDENIIKKEEIINKLSEYKKSIIYEAVTGKREV